MEIGYVSWLEVVRVSRFMRYGATAGMDSQVKYRVVDASERGEEDMGNI